MEWLNLHARVLDSPEVIGSTPVERATWLFLLRFCMGQENGGRICQSQVWGDRKWQQVARVTLREVRRVSRLWCWDGPDLLVAFYPVEKEASVRVNRENAARGGQAKTQAKTQASRANGELGGRPNNPSENPTERKGKERKGKEEGGLGIKTPTPLDILDGMNRDETAIEIAKPLAQEPHWRDWRLTHSRVFVGNHDGTPQDWESLFKFYGSECMDGMYRRIFKEDKTKRIYFNQANEWLEKNTKEEINESQAQA